MVIDGSKINLTESSGQAVLESIKANAAALEDVTTKLSPRIIVSID